MVNINCVCVDRYGRRFGFTDEQEKAVIDSEPVTVEKSEILDKTENGNGSVDIVSPNKFVRVCAVTRAGNKMVKYFRNHDIAMCEYFKLRTYPLFLIVTITRGV